MFRSKLAPCLLALCLCGCASQSQQATEETKKSLLTEVLTDSDSSYSQKVKTASATTGDIVTTFSGKGKISFSISENLVYYCDFANMYMGRIFAQTGSYVKAGEPLFELYIYGDDVEFTEKKLYLNRITASYERKCAQFEEDLLLLTEGELSYEEKALEYEEYKREALAEIENTRLWIDNYSGIADNHTVTITAPYDCHVDSTTNAYTWSIIGDGETVMGISSTDGWMYRIKDSGYMLKVGSEVIVSEGDFSAKGTIIYNSNAEVSNSGGGWGYYYTQKENYAYVSLEGEYDVSALPETVGISADTISIKNVVLIPEACVNQEDGRYFVYIMKGDVKEKVYFHCPYYKSGLCWAIDGINAGDILVVN